MRRVDKTVVGVVAGIERSHAVQLPKKNGGEQMVYSKWVVGMTLEDLIEFLHRMVIIQIVEVIERSEIQWVIRAIGKRMRVVSRLGEGKDCPKGQRYTPA